MGRGRAIRATIPVRKTKAVITLLILLDAEQVHCLLICIGQVMKKLLSVMMIFGLLAACTDLETTPLVSDYNGASVKIQTDMFTPKPRESTMAEATRICGIGNKRAEYASSRALPNYVNEHLYLCL